MQRLLLLLVKAVVTGLLIYLSVRAVSLTVVLDRLGDIELSWIALGIVVLVAQIALQAARWRRIVQAAGFPLPATGALRLSFVAAFFNQTLPSTIGGDAVRMWMLAQNYKAGWKAGVYSVFVDRAIGVFALAVVVALCLPWTFLLVQDPLGRIMVTLVAAAGITGGFVFAALSAARATWIERIWGVRHLIAASLVLRRVASPLGRAAFVAAASILIHLMTVLVAWSAARSIQASAGFMAMMCVIPPVVLIATIPITIAGWGLRESLMISAFTLAGLDAGDALVISLLLGAANFLVGLLGGGIWIAGRTRAAAVSRPSPV